MWPSILKNYQSVYKFSKNYQKRDDFFLFENKEKLGIYWILQKIIFRERGIKTYRRK